tara:strand:+ start:767 stop:1006 length:240 start_codon:yes stop_codon:yes gene_type:complete
MALVDDYLDDVEMLKISVENDKEKILKAIDLDVLMANPADFLRHLGNEFISQHLDEVKSSYEKGQGFAKKVLNEVQAET